MMPHIRHIILACILIGGLAIAVTALTSPRPVPAFGDTITGLRVGTGYTCSITSAENVICWGQNDFGQLGDGTTTDSPSPVQVVLSGAAVDEMEAGGFHACVLTDTAIVSCWGRNDSGQLGDGTTIDHITPAPVASLAGTVAALAAGTKHSCVLSTAGAVQCWGRNDYGQVGQPTSELCRSDVPCSTLPVTVSGLSSGVASISAGGFHSCAITVDGAAICWGRNTFGQLGNGELTSTTSPQDVLELDSGVLSISTGSRHSCALLDTGGVKCWGHNGFGQLGNAEACGFSCSTPVDVAGLDDAVAVSVGNFHSCALTAGGSVRCWGRNDFGQVGNGTTDNVHTAIEVVGLGSGVVSLRIGGFHGCAQVQDGSVQCWGDNTFGQLGAPGGNQCSFGLCRTTPVKATVLQKNSPTPTPKNPAADTDGDTIINSVDLDDDNDSCSDTVELGSDETLGGLRDPHNFWDFYDPSRDGSVTIIDFFALLQRFGTVGDPGIDPLSTPPSPPAYHPRFDRGSVIGDNPWNLGAPDGAIATTDFFSLLVQFGHVCV